MKCNLFLATLIGLAGASQVSSVRASHIKHRQLGEVLMHRLILTLATAAAITVESQAYAMSSSVADFPEFTACPVAKGTWWATSGKEDLKYAPGRNMLLVVKEGRLHYSADWSRGSMDQLKEVRFVQRVSGQMIQIKTLNLALYDLRKTGNKFTGTLDYGGAGGMPTITNVEFVCGG
jgi:hypothetical protein